MKALKCCKINFLQIRTNWKYWICLAFVVLQMWSITGDMGAYAQALHYPHVAPWLLPHLPAFIQKYTVLLIIFLVLVSDAPFRTAQQQLVIQRVGKRKWIIGQLLFLFAMSVLYSLLLWLLSWIFYAPMVEWTPEWGKVIFSSTNYDLTSGTRLFGSVAENQRPVLPVVSRRTDCTLVGHYRCRFPSVRPP